jgi:protein-S-isoprenylcysteine O-methyltransferase Ste14
VLPSPIIALGALLNLAILGLPCYFLGLPHAEGLFCLGVFYVAATVFYMGDCLSPVSRLADDERATDVLAERRHERLAFVTGIVVLIGLWLALAEEIVLARSGWLGFRFLGIALFCAGVTLRIAAIRALGRQFRTTTTIRRGRLLVTGGVYAWLRHPSESGLILIVLGTSLMFVSLAAVGFTAVALLPLIVLRLRIEERGLKEVFGPQYDAYQRTTGGLVPYLLRRSRLNLEKPDDSRS